ncbi:Ribosomal protein S6 kinase alpha-5 [Bonamia ostreae]|uniref:Ribosomal protein S6 kinase alpha-5 n=1 Tax=Bonamia ostreae TaxID=126728 RepID=A0ABV2AFU1_9EUKA
MAEEEQSFSENKIVLSWYEPNSNENDLFTFRRKDRSTNCICVKCDECESKIEDYEICSYAGHGGNGAVFRVVDKETREISALKAMRKLDKLMLCIKTEVEVSEKLKGLDCVCNIKHVFESSEYVFVVSEWLACSLEDVNNCNEFSSSQIGNIVVNLVDAMLTVHDKGVILADMKLSNIMLDNEGNLKFIDFGCSTDTDKDVGNRRVGTVGYRAPEMSETGLTKVSDCYSLGVIIVILCGIPQEDIVTKDEHTKKYHSKIEGEKNVISETPFGEDLDLVLLVDNLLEKTPEERIQPKDYSKIHMFHFLDKILKPHCECSEKASSYKLGQVISYETNCLVFEAVKLEEKYAVKGYLKTPENINEVLNEIRICSRLKHPNILKQLHVFEAPQCLYVMTELCEVSLNDMHQGQTVRQLGNMLLLEQDIDEIAASIVIVLMYLAANDVIHTNLCLRNVMFTKSGILKLTGFGRSVDLTGNTRNIKKKVNLEFSAPEVHAGYATVKSPYWNLGIILYELRTPSNTFVEDRDTNLDSNYIKFADGCLEKSTIERKGFILQNKYPKYIKDVIDRIGGVNFLGKLTKEQYFNLYY